MKKSGKKKWLIIGAVGVVILILVVINLTQTRSNAVQVTSKKVTVMDI